MRIKQMSSHRLDGALSSPAFFDQNYFTEDE